MLHHIIGTLANLFLGKFTSNQRAVVISDTLLPIVIGKMTSRVQETAAQPTGPVRR